MFKTRYLTEEDTGSAPSVQGPSNAEKFIAPVKSQDTKVGQDNSSGLTKNTVEHSTNYMSNSYAAKTDTRPTLNDASKTQTQIDRDVTNKQGTFEQPKLSSNFQKRYSDILPS